MSKTFQEGFLQESIEAIRKWESELPVSLIDMTTGEYRTAAPSVHTTSSVLFPTKTELDNAGSGEKPKNFKRSDLPTRYSDYGYGSDANPTLQQLRHAITLLEGGSDSRTFLAPMGITALAYAIKSLVQTGDHVLIPNNTYGPLTRYCREELGRFGVSFNQYDPTNSGSIKDQIKSNTKILHIENPGSVSFEVADLEEIVRIAKEHNIITIADNSWATPIFSNPIHEGVDIVVHALTKYLGGQANVYGGSITAEGERVYEPIHRTLRYTGICMDPRAAQEVLLGLRTLPARMKSQLEKAEKVVEALYNQPEMSQLLYPADPNHSQHELWRKNFRGATPLFSTAITGHPQEKVEEALAAMHPFRIGESWGGPVSMVNCYTQQDREGTLVRFYIGQESERSMVAGIEKGFKVLRE